MPEQWKSQAVTKYIENDGEASGVAVRWMGRLLIGVLAITMPIAAVRSQTNITYTYDALGRLTQSSISGGRQSGTANTIQYDQAGNRRTYQVMGAPTGGGSSTSGSSATTRAIVLPLNGFTIIPIP